MNEQIQTYFFKLWRPALIALVIGILAYLLFFHNLTHLLPGYAPREVNTYNSASSLQVILDHPMNSPYKFMVYAVSKLGHHSLLVTRVAAATFAVVASLLFFIVARTWYGYRVAFFATVLFTTSAGFLHVARLGSPLILQMGLLLLIACKLWWDKTKRRNIVDFCLVAAVAALCYVPGMIWFELLVLVLLHKRILQAFHGNSPLKKMAIGAFLLVALAPLLRAFIIFPSTLLTFAGLPQAFASVGQTLHHFVGSILSIGVYSSGSPELWLGHAPLLNTIELVLLLLGAYTCYKHMPKDRWIFVYTSILIGLLLIGLNGPVDISVLLPLLYLLMGGGIYELLQQWFTIFPSNPFARFAGIFCICTLVFFSGMYQFRAYFIAWPHNTATRSSFNQHNLP